MIGLEVAQGSELRTYINSVFSLPSEHKSSHRPFYMNEEGDNKDQAPVEKQEFI